MTFDLTNENDVADLKQAFNSSFSGPMGEKTLKFLESFCGFYLGGPREDLHKLHYEQGRRDVILTLKTILNKEWSPKQIAESYKKQER